MFGHITNVMMELLLSRNFTSIFFIEKKKNNINNNQTWDQFHFLPTTFYYE